MRKKHNEEKKTIQWGETIKLNILKQTSINEHMLYETVLNWGKENWCPLILTESVSLSTHSRVRWRDNIITKYDVSTKAQYSYSPTRVASADSQRLKTARRRKICSLDMFRASVQSNLVWRDANKQFRRVGSGGVNMANM